MLSFLRFCSYVFTFTLLFSSIGVVNAANNLNPVIVKGNAFFDSVTNKRFYIRGVAYQVFRSPFWGPLFLDKLTLLF